MSPKACFGLWLYTGTIVLILLCMVLFNPDDALGESQTITWLGFSFSTYPVQSALLQFLGTFIVSMSVMPPLFKSSTPRSVTIIALVGSAVVMIGQAIESIEEASLLPDMAPAMVPAFLVVIGFYVVPVWIVVAGWARISRVCSWLKSRIKSSG